MLNYRVWWFYMEDKLVPKFLTKLKDKFSKNKTNNDVKSEYAFSTAELETISNQNKQKIQELKQDMFTKKKKKEPLKTSISETIDIKVANSSNSTAFFMFVSKRIIIPIAPKTAYIGNLMATISTA